MINDRSVSFFFSFTFSYSFQTIFKWINGDKCGHIKCHSCVLVEIITVNVYEIIYKIPLMRINFMRLFFFFTISDWATVSFWWFFVWMKMNVNCLLDSSFHVFWMYDLGVCACTCFRIEWVSMYCICVVLYQCMLKCDRGCKANRANCVLGNISLNLCV